MENGNFGNKYDFGVDNAGVLIGNAPDEGRNVFFSFKTLVNLQYRGCKLWKATQKYKILKCVAWAYLPVRYVFRLITGKRDFKHLRSVLSATRRRYPLISKLRLYRE
jgi:hypothetical protein